MRPYTLETVICTSKNITKRKLVEVALKFERSLAVREKQGLKPAKMRPFLRVSAYLLLKSFSHSSRLEVTPTPSLPIGPISQRPS